MTEPLTSLTLLTRARELDAEAWYRLVRLYYPLVYQWCRRAGMQDDDAGDVCQEVFSGLATSFDQYRPELRFRPWLRGITANKVRMYWRRHASEQRGRGGSDAQIYLESLTGGRQGDETPTDEPAEISAVVRRVLDFIQPEFSDETWKAFWQTAVENRSAGDVAADLGISRNAVYIAKSRVLGRLRTELAGLLD